MIADNIKLCKIVVQTDQGQVYLHEDFSIDLHTPIAGFVKIKDNIDGRVFWFNFNAITWIGPRE